MRYILLKFLVAAFLKLSTLLAKTRKDCTGSFCAARAEL